MLISPFLRFLGAHEGSILLRGPGMPVGGWIIPHFTWSVRGFSCLQSTSDSQRSQWYYVRRQGLLSGSAVCVPCQTISSKACLFPWRPGLRSVDLRNEASPCTRGKERRLFQLGLSKHGLSVLLFSRENNHQWWQTFKAGFWRGTARRRALGMLMWPLP